MPMEKTFFIKTNNRFYYVQKNKNRGGIMEKDYNNTVYRFLNINNEIIYVGKSIGIRQRLKNHKHLPKECYEETKKIEVVFLPTQKDMNLAEIYYISKFSPKYNKNYNVEGEVINIPIPYLDELKWEKFEEKPKRIKKVKKVRKKKKEKKRRGFNRERIRQQKALENKIFKEYEDKRKARLFVLKDSLDKMLENNHPLFNLLKELSLLEVYKSLYVYGLNYKSKSCILDSDVQFYYHELNELYFSYSNERTVRMKLLALKRLNLIEFIDSPQKCNAIKILELTDELADNALQIWNYYKEFGINVNSSKHGRFFEKLEYVKYENGELQKNKNLSKEEAYFLKHGYKIACILLEEKGYIYKKEFLRLLDPKVKFLKSKTKKMYYEVFFPIIVKELELIPVYANAKIKKEYPINKKIKCNEKIYIKNESILQHSNGKNRDESS